MEKKAVIHLDLDYFFAQVEERKNPSIFGKPVVVCVYTNEKEQKGAVTTANYVARKFGVHSGIPITQAKKLLNGKDAVFLPANYELYEEISYGIRNILFNYSDKIEQASIDEFYIQVPVKEGIHEAEKIAVMIKNEILKKFKLTCSVGIGPNKLIAKIAAGINKPDGLTLVKEEQVQDFLDPLEVDRIPGIGKKTKEYLQSKGIFTIKQLRIADFAELAEELGKKAAGALREAANGIDNSPVEEEKQKQISRMVTITDGAKDALELEKTINELSREIAEELNRVEFVGKVVGIQVIDKDMKVYNRSTTLQSPTKDAEIIAKTANELCKKFFLEKPIELRRIGVRVEKLETIKGQKSLANF
ncbi:MAG: DNA polymerase IV [Candidatus Bilamarchaeaceae archaeon]